MQLGSWSGVIGFEWLVPAIFVTPELVLKYHDSGNIVCTDYGSL